jgi:hypothetical protein
MRKQYEQACMDIRNIDGQDTIDLLLAMPKLSSRIWKHLFDHRDLDGHVATTQKEVAAELGVAPQHISTSFKYLLENDHVQRNGIHFYINPYHWWYGEDHRKQTARTEWDKRKEICGTNNNK